MRAITMLLSFPLARRTGSTFLRISFGRGVAALIFTTSLFRRSKSISCLSESKSSRRSINRRRRRRKRCMLHQLPICLPPPKHPSVPLVRPQVAVKWCYCTSEFPTCNTSLILETHTFHNRHITIPVSVAKIALSVYLAYQPGYLVSILNQRSG